MSIQMTWGLYDSFLTGGVAETPRESAIQSAVDVIVNGITEDPSYQEDALVNGENVPLAASRKSEVECELTAAPGSRLFIGDMVYCFDEHWVVTSSYIDQIGLVKGKMWLCNNLLRFQNETATINERHCVVDDGAYSKHSGNQPVVAPNNTYKVYLTIDAATKKLFVDKRLGFGKIYSARGDEILEVYNITGIDLKSMNFGAGSHLMVMTVQRGVYNADTDDLAENICDFISNSETPPQPSEYGSCDIQGVKQIRIGTTRKFIASFKNDDGEVSAEPVWSVTVPDGCSYSVTSDGACSVTVPLKESFVGKSIQITLGDSGGLFGSCEKTVGVIQVG